jgi:G:T-mismatch repair DNA endonuclease (very short patch repair protein)
MAYNSLGYKCLILWEKEVKYKTPEELTKVITNFTRVKGRQQ